jgi:hypothetical protein
MQAAHGVFVRLQETICRRSAWPAKGWNLTRAGRAMVAATLREELIERDGATLGWTPHRYRDRVIVQTNRNARIQLETDRHLLPGASGASKCAGESVKITGFVGYLTSCAVSTDAPAIKLSMAGTSTGWRAVATGGESDTADDTLPALPSPASDPLFIAQIAA